MPTTGPVTWSNRPSVRSIMAAATAGLRGHRGHRAHQVVDAARDQLPPYRPRTPTARAWSPAPGRHHVRQRATTSTDGTQRQDRDRRQRAQDQGNTSAETWGNARTYVRRAHALEVWQQRIEGHGQLGRDRDGTKSSVGQRGQHRRQHELTSSASRSRRTRRRRRARKQGSASLAATTEPFVMPRWRPRMLSIEANTEASSRCATPVLKTTP